jgi:hypothetical protein
MAAFLTGIPFKVKNQSQEDAALVHPEVVFLKPFEEAYLKILFTVIDRRDILTGAIHKWLFLWHFRIFLDH